MARKQLATLAPDVCCSSVLAAPLWTPKPKTSRVSSRRSPTRYAFAS